MRRGIRLKVTRNQSIFGRDPRLTPKQSAINYSTTLKKKDKTMNNKTFRDHVSQQCGFNKTQPQRLLESIILNKANYRDQSLQYCGCCDIERAHTFLSDGWECQVCGTKPDSRRYPSNKAIQVCNAGDWPTVEDQKRYWQERDEHLDKIESAALWFDSKAKQERHPFA